jgi:hypothetical protein
MFSMLLVGKGYPGRGFPAYETIVEAYAILRNQDK